VAERADEQPPTMPARMPEKSGAFDASATPRQSGSATRKTTRPAVRSAVTVAARVGLEVCVAVIRSADRPDSR